MRTTFSSGIMKSVDKMIRIYSRRKHLIEASFPIIDLTYIFSDRDIRVKLLYFSQTDKLELCIPDQKLYSKISYYDFRNKTERRWVRNKNFLFQLILDLKNSGLWDYVENKDFLEVNKYNKRADTNDRRNILRQVLRQKPKGISDNE